MCVCVIYFIVNLLICLLFMNKSQCVVCMAVFWYDHVCECVCVRV